MWSILFSFKWRKSCPNHDFMSEMQFVTRLVGVGASVFSYEGMLFVRSKSDITLYSGKVGSVSGTVRGDDIGLSEGDREFQSWI